MLSATKSLEGGQNDRRPFRQGEEKSPRRGVLQRAYGRDVETIRADVDGLFAFGAACKRSAEALSAGHPAQQSGPSFQSSTAAVEAVLTLAGRAENLISMRLRVTGHAVVSAGNRLAECDSASSERIATVGDAPTVL
jgi:hypothetical protein